MLDQHNYTEVLKSAILSFTNNVSGVGNFEANFDGVIYNLKIAHSYTVSANQSADVQRVLQELFYAHVMLIEQRFLDLKDKQAQNILDGIRKIFSGQHGKSVADYAAAFSMEACITILAVDIAVKSLGLYFENFYIMLQINDRKNSFFIQLARIYRKITQTDLYTGRYELIDSTIERNKVNIINGIIELNEWDEGIEFLAILKSRDIFNLDNIEKNSLTDTGNH